MKNQKKLASINVPWVITVVEDVHQWEKKIDSTTVISSFAQTFWGKPWVDFLFEHAVDIKVISHYNPATVLYNIDIKFYLPPEQETMYRLRFN